MVETKRDTGKNLVPPRRLDSGSGYVFVGDMEQARAGAEIVRRSITDVWTKESRRNVELATEKVLRMWEVSTSASELWQKTALHHLKQADTAKNRAYRAAAELVSEGLIETSTADRARKLVEVLFTPNTIYSSIGPDDGGLTMYWPAGDMSIEIDIYPGEGYWWRVRNVAGANYSGNGNELPIEDLKYSLTWFSKEVDRANPHWRNQRT